MENKLKVGDKVIYTGRSDSLTPFEKVYIVRSIQPEFGVNWIRIDTDDGSINGFLETYLIKAIEVQ